MRVLFVVTPDGGHLTPLAPLAWALRGAGHEVLTTGQPDVQAAAASAGLSAASIGDWYGMTELIRAWLPHGGRPIECWGHPARTGETGDFARAWAIHNETVLAGYLDLARAFRPDLIVADGLEYCSLILGGLLDVPVVHHRWGVDPLTGPTRAQARETHRELLDAHGLSALPDPAVVLDPCPPSLQLPKAEPGTPIRHVDSHGNGPLPDWLHREWTAATRGAEGRRRVVVSLGRNVLALNGVPLTRGILRAFADLPKVEAVATIHNAYWKEIGPVPDNVRLVDPTPLNLLLADHDVVVHHGGAGTTMSATWRGLPQLVLPQLADQFAHGQRLAELGAGIALDEAHEQNDPARISAALAELLAEPGFTKAAGELRHEMTRMPTPAQVVRDLEQLA
ncbi:nucleotide disphospho-sugar-binding domain-containing protein [Kitasatospora sp. NPDC052896]|uniref:nucleotide disphospho-sugar-binding domain-containing protein n=1 Tax=Kitasatospora sp. NPDC052896 TaxID=3364061 RepID=UPI0037C60ABF